MYIYIYIMMCYLCILYITNYTLYYYILSTCSMLYTGHYIKSDVRFRYEYDKVDIKS